MAKPGSVVKLSKGGKFVEEETTPHCTMQVFGADLSECVSKFLPISLVVGAIGSKGCSRFQAQDGGLCLANQLRGVCLGFRV